MRAADHAAVLDGLREWLVLELAAAREDQWAARGYQGCLLWRAALDRARDICRQIRALDAVRAALRDRRVSAEAWMLIACGKPHRTAFAEARAMVAATPEVPEL